MKVLVACEYSGIVRESFLKRGHDAMSCDLLPSEIPGNHYQGDVLDIINQSWDMLIAFPPCTYLCSSGYHWNYKRPERMKKTEDAIVFFMKLINAPINKICIENSIGIMSTRYRKPDQIIQPYEYGHPESKATCLWLKNLPLLEPTKYAEFKTYRCCGNTFEEKFGKYGCPICNGKKTAKPLWENMTKSGQNKLTPSDNRSKIRSKTYQGIADAMADQWG